MTSSDSSGKLTPIIGIICQSVTIRSSSGSKAESKTATRSTVCFFCLVDAPSRSTFKSLYALLPRCGSLLRVRGDQCAAKWCDLSLLPGNRSKRNSPLTIRKEPPPRSPYTLFFLLHFLLFRGVGLVQL